MIENRKNATAVGGKNDDIDIGHLLGTLVDQRWLLIGVTSLFAVVGIVYSLFATPIYQSDALVQVEKNAGSSILNNLSETLSAGETGSTTEMELIQSRMVTGKTVQDLNLDTVVEQKYFPIFGKGWARLNGQKPSELALSRFSVPEYMQGQPIVLTIVDKNNYILSYDGEELLNGKAGQLASKGGVTLLVSDFNAIPGTEFTLTKQPLLNTINSLLGNLSVVDKGKDSGVLNLSYTGEDPKLVRKTLDSISNNYLLQNVERKSEEAARSLAFLKEQLPSVRNALDEAENKLNLFRQQNDSVDLSLEAKSVLDTIVATESQLNELTFREAEISKLYTKEHPAYRALLEKRKTLQQEKDKLNKRVSAMPKTQQEIIRLTRDVDAGKEIYMQLLNKQQELSITKASTVGNVRIIDPAITQPKPVKPRKALIILLATILGAMISVTIVLIKAMMHKGIESPEELEQEGINVYASIPLSEWQQKIDRESVLRTKRKSNVDSVSLLATGNPADLAIEAVRSLRTSLHFAMLEAKNNVLMISGASPNIGKTFVSTNLAAVISQSNQKVLIIDADMRKGYSHKLLGTGWENGLSDILSLQTSVEKAVRSTTVEGMDFIPRGQIPPNPSELLMSSRFKDLIEWASKNYDIVLIDTPPILAVTDAAIIGHHAGTALMIARFATNTVKEIEVSIRRFEQNGVDIKGVILNAVEKRASSYYGGYGYYQYEYRSADKA
ncbi:MULTISPECIES: tyrosine-protein kinase Wzc [Serratia]|uniref:Tyrosine-protein kinase Wzc n=1 Tax=Serratia liquefaciens TaxID=614 RepID=A0A515D4Y1_SERLI|nr:tyrosine-protein kinase Wzc [Serratia liquefaciens]MBI6163516.1 tyrosine-protein kinase Wzc [Serratia liquefaciens]MBV0841052.1 tyrosine-protein kinase Wzc [Serratia liquefaciens]QDL35469.1 tyrosine-protein kinase Wzc [Serratia liquefaciens]HCT9095966.1 tyrosine-protein kinase Wzc [Serratia liquefaciens]HED2337212.1 tyrosine-protein kinase Wzc [Serratia liquefaciens]